MSRPVALSFYLLAYVLWILIENLTKHTIQWNYSKQWPGQISGISSRKKYEVWNGPVGLTISFTAVWFIVLCRKNVLHFLKCFLCVCVCVYVCGCLPYTLPYLLLNGKNISTQSNNKTVAQVDSVLTQRNASPLYKLVFIWVCVMSKTLDWIIWKLMWVRWTPLKMNKLAFQELALRQNNSV